VLIKLRRKDSLPRYNPTRLKERREKMVDRRGNIQRLLERPKKSKRATKAKRLMMVANKVLSTTRPSKQTARKENRFNPAL
jgi:hypothetical protein